jgi:hypothetical protein
MWSKRLPRTVADLADQDYADKLTPEERERWVNQFNAEFYNAAFVEEEPLHRDGSEERRELYRDKDVRNRDLFNRGLRSGGAVELAAAVEAEGDPRPFGSSGYLQSEGYKAALNEFRRNLPTDDKKIPRITPEFVASKQKLEAVTGSKSIIRGERSLGYDRATYERMIKTRLQKLEEVHQVIMHLGAVVVRHQFTGAECEAAVSMLKWLDTQRERLEEKIKKLGGKVPAEKAEASNG